MRFGVLRYVFQVLLTFLIIFLPLWDIVVRLFGLESLQDLIVFFSDFLYFTFTNFIIKAFMCRRRSWRIHWWVWTCTTHSWSLMPWPDLAGAIMSKLTHTILPLTSTVVHYYWSTCHYNYIHFKNPNLPSLILGFAAIIVVIFSSKILFSLSISVYLSIKRIFINSKNTTTAYPSQSVILWYLTLLQLKLFGFRFQMWIPMRFLEHLFLLLSGSHFH